MATAVRRALILSPLAATATFIAIPTLFASVAQASGDLRGGALAFGALVALSFGIVVLGASFAATLVLYYGARISGIELMTQSRSVLLVVGAIAASALVAGGRLWLSDEVEWTLLWLAVPAGLVGAYTFHWVGRPRLLTTVGD